MTYRFIDSSLLSNWPYLASVEINDCVNSKSRLVGNSSEMGGVMPNLLLFVALILVAAAVFILGSYLNLPVSVPYKAKNANFSFSLEEV